MTFNDIFKSSFLEQVESFAPLDMVIALVLALALGLFILLIYRKTFTGVMYSASFGLSLMALTLITTLVIMAVTSNVVLSLGMVGALSIVRFRAAIKEPLDIAFLFWAIAAGIVLGAGLLPLAVFGSLFIGVILLAFANRRSGYTPYLLVVTCGNESEQPVMQAVQQEAKKYQLKSKTVSPDGMELTVEVRLPGDSSQLVNEAAVLPGVRSAVLVSYNGEYMS
ncbi:DUF4956 domain-containing protein [Anaeromassilibacillus sp. An200]|uniref:DUF4956 domain-containing protein n=1 Tax=Anaeromassilibacillus sp. An200 TaxID=1965587 RepID=UPI000B367102|nr:DUF4956 domain-containing protein [Anaeromassilibacillus sp. An200]OUP13529.1 DUF4956 domain-containing protein [Anaeromassilibacillus sp. An200]